MAKAALAIVKKTTHETDTHPFKAMSMIDRFKWAGVGLLVVLGLWCHSYLLAYPIAQVLGMLVAFLGAIGFAFWTTQGMQFWQFIVSARMEMQKVVWPTRQETIQSTIAVVAMVVVVALFLWGTDSILLRLIGWVTMSARGA